MADDTPMTDNTPQTLHDAMLAVAGELAETGISKDWENTQQHYKFRGIDDILNRVAPLFVKYGVVMTPVFSLVQIKDFDRQTRSGTARWTHAVLQGAFTFRKNAESLIVTTIGEGMDNTDKACNKAMSAATKYALILAFTIPTVGSEDGEFHSLTVQGDAISNPIDTSAWMDKIDDANTREDGERLWQEFTAAARGSSDTVNYSIVKEYFVEAKEAKGWADAKDVRATR